MSPIERRIVHLALQDDQDVTTESRGDGFYKRVAIIPRPAAQSSES
jgi:spoIIIJ-associated protein